jgi:Fe-S oxidoreductase
MAKLKAEVRHQHHRAEGSGLRERLFADVDALARLGSATAPLSNWLPKLPGARWLLSEMVGIAADRELPTFADETLLDWFDARGGCRLPPSEADDQALLVPDTYTNYVYPAPGRAAVRALEALGVYVRVPGDLAPSGRAAFSTGHLDLARERAEANVAALSPRVADGWSVLFVEPSDAVMYQDEYRDLLDGPAVERVAANAHGVLEYVDVARLDEGAEFDAPDQALAYHGHCNQKAIKTDHHAVGVLRRAGYRVEPLDATCCGMAGSFGYEAEHYGLSQAIGRLLFDAVDESDVDEVIVPGASCRTQLADRPGGRLPSHPVEKLAEALSRGR